MPEAPLPPPEAPEAPPLAPAGGPDEWALRAAALRGDEAAWRALHERAFAPTWAFAVARTRGDVPAAEEVVQETWLVAVRRLAAFDPARAPFEAWLRGIAGNVLKNRVRGARRAPRLLPLPASGPEDPATIPPGPGSDVREEVALALTALPWAYQQALRARYAERLPLVEIGARLGRTAKAAESLLARAREALRAALGRGGEGSS